MGELKADANILISCFYDYRGEPERREYDWQGGRVVCISRQVLGHVSGYKPGMKVFSVGPFRLRVIDEDYRRVYCVREGPAGWALALWIATYKALDKVYRRLVITVAVWGLAQWNDATVPTWRDVHVLRRLAGWLKR
jgi:hypothetical protein